MQLTQRRGSMAHFSIAGTECERGNEERMETRKVSSGVSNSGLRNHSKNLGRFIIL